MDFELPEELRLLKDNLRKFVDKELIPLERDVVNDIKLQKELPNCEELVRIPGAGHASNVSHPAAVNGPLLDFLRRHSS